MSANVFWVSTTIAAATCYSTAGALFLFFWQVVFRRRRKLGWRRFLLALSVTVASALGVMFALALNADYPAESGGWGAFGVLLLSFVLGGLVGLVLLVVAWWFLSTGKRAPSRVPAIPGDAQKPRNLYLRILLFLAVLPSVFQTLSLDRKLGEAAPYAVFGMCAVGLLGLGESLFRSHRDRAHDRAITRRLLVVGLAGAAITAGVLIWTLVTRDSYLGRSGPHLVWWISLLLATLSIVIETRELRYLAALARGPGSAI